jgi:hypothetical protein
MFNRMVLVTIGLLLAACHAREIPPPPDPYVGRPVSDLALRVGPPDIQIDAGNNQRGFIWRHTAVYPCLSAVGHSLQPPGPGLGNWIIDHWQTTGCSQ